MLQAFVITLREGIEAFLIVAISLAYLRKSGKSHLIPAVKWGIGAALLLSIGTGVLFERVANQSLWEGILAIVAAILIGTLIIHMWRTARFMKTRIEHSLGASAAREGRAALVGVFLFTVLMITREGMETALLMDTLIFQVGSLTTLSGAVLGLLSAALVAWIWSRFGHRINLGRFLQVTAIFLFVFVAQLLIYGFHELTEAHVVPGSDFWHAVTEPYGPDGRYGHLLSYGLVLLPLLWLAVSWLRDAMSDGPWSEHKA